MKIYCNNCKTNTTHVDQGPDIRPDKRFYCIICRKSNSK